MLKNKWFVFIMIFIFVLSVLGGCNRKTEETIEENPSVVEKEEAEEEAIPIDSSEEENSLQRILASRPGILAFWVSWNEESKQQLEILENVYKLVEEDVAVLGIHATTFDTMSKEEVFKDLEDYTFEMLLDEEGEIQETYYVGNFPTIVFLDKEGKVVYSYTTLVEEDAILEKLTLLLESL
ncbi:peroxiredoxin [Clostridium aceticum]|uniref:Peroxiredoxin n=1 Tax=Clostridium aceticum TaxID=84022 RepID=A0A0D8IA86_9CLOT|nr:TlpA disulfide reductase family protein [Clostridium aceticum]AKL93593.1 peroxiredoxin [Clostridium aceticum]KJF27183.1 hypothetical protein TZ02_08905 [Clostridium aceticum]